MISKNKIKYLRSLEQKKNRDTNNVFVAEGPKNVGDILSCHKFKTIQLLATEEWIRNTSLEDINDNCDITTVTQEELSKISFLCHPQQVLAVFEKNKEDLQPEELKDNLTLVLDGVQDPGNLGTIIRIADWFGIEHVVCSKDTVDVYNPKVVQATMGSIARVNVHYIDLDDFFDSIPKSLPIYGTLLEGKNIYKTDITNNGIIIMGNEGKGISPQIRKRITTALRIPNFPEERQTADSLNVAIATSVVCAEFRRRR